MAKLATHQNVYVKFITIYIIFEFLAITIHSLRHRAN